MSGRDLKKKSKLSIVKKIKNGLTSPENIKGDDIVSYIILLAIVALIVTMIGPALPKEVLVFVLFVFMVMNSAYDLRLGGKTVYGIETIIWRKEAIEYFKKLESKKVEIEEIKLEKDFKFLDSLAKKIPYITHEFRDLTPCKITIQDENNELKTIYTNSIVEYVEGLENPYIEYKTLKEDIGFKLNPGLINVHVFLPGEVNKDNQSNSDIKSIKENENNDNEKTS